MQNNKKCYCSYCHHIWRGWTKFDRHPFDNVGISVTAVLWKTTAQCCFHSFRAYSATTVVPWGDILELSPFL